MTNEERNKQAWHDLLEVLNRGDFAAMDAFFHPDFTYDNRSRPDLNTFAEWKKSPIANYATFGFQYAVKKMVAEGDEVWVYFGCKGKHTGGPYMGVQPTGNITDVDTLSIVKFRDGKIIKITSIADVLLQLIQIGVIDKSALPLQPNR